MEQNTKYEYEVVHEYWLRAGQVVAAMQAQVDKLVAAWKACAESCKGVPVIDQAAAVALNMQKALATMAESIATGNKDNEEFAEEMGEVQAVDMLKD